VTRSVWLAFTPQDTVLVRDGRSFDATSDAAAQAVWPGPSTLGGAVKAAFNGAEPGEIRGPVLAQRTAHGWQPHFPVPSDMVTASATEAMRLSPRTLPVETDLGEYIIQLRHEPPSHIIAPAIHKTKGQVAELFSKELRRPGLPDVLRHAFLGRLRPVLCRDE
jgi:hypothetical protein